MDYLKNRIMERKFKRLGRLLGKGSSYQSQESLEVLYIHFSTEKMPFSSTEEAINTTSVIS